MPRKMGGLANRVTIVVEPFIPWPYGLFTSPHTYIEKPQPKPKKGAKRKKPKCKSSSRRTSFASLLASR